MLSYVKKQTVTITIGVSFFLCGFFTVANLLHLSDRDVLVGLVAGAIGGITILVVSSTQERRSRSASVQVG
jgi:hypothetical protein